MRRHSTDPPGRRGLGGRGGGAALLVPDPSTWRASTVQACGVWPFATGAQAPRAGVPLGRHLVDGQLVCADPITWFTTLKLIANPSAFILGKPSLGKSTAVRRMALGLAAQGVMPLILGDLKPDYVDLTRALGGQVITLGPGRGRLNLLDPGHVLAAAARLTGSARAVLLADAHARRLASLCGLLSILRAAPVGDREETVLDRALHVLDDHHRNAAPPVLSDLLELIRAGHPDVRAVALDRGSIDRYRDLTEPLESGLTALCSATGRLGGVFSGATTIAMRTDVPVCFDLSGIEDTHTDLQAAALLACWSTGFAAVAAAHALADAGLEPRRHHLVVLDELWRALRAGRGLVDRIDALTRLNRTRGVGQVMVSHTMSDLHALPHPEDRAKAKGFVERAGMLITAGLPAAEMPLLTSAVALSSAEQQLLTSWTDPPAWNPAPGTTTAPGRGLFLIKVGGRPGIPIRMDLTPTERALGIHDTDKLWHPKVNGFQGSDDHSDAIPLPRQLGTTQPTGPAAGPAS
jgi:hypothetical protein